MSATADGARLAALMDARVIESAGRMHPVQVEHAKRDIPSARDLPDALARAVRAALAAHDGDILAFLPGMGEIRRTQAALEGCGALVLPLHGELPAAEQDRALRPAEGRRVVLATSVAETSLTVPGIRVVVDGGWRRSPRLDGSTGLTRLTTVRISRAAADQRAGRAGREAPGVAIRLWSQVAASRPARRSIGRRSSTRSFRPSHSTARPGVHGLRNWPFPTPHPSPPSRWEARCSNNWGRSMRMAGSRQQAGAWRSSAPTRASRR